MQTLHVNGYDMAYLEVGPKDARPLVCVHGSLCDFRIWSPVLGPLSRSHRVVAVSLRHCFPEHWDGTGDGYSIAQHVLDTIAFLEAFGSGPADLLGHSRGGHIAFRVAQRRPDLLRKLILAEPGGAPDETLVSGLPSGRSPFAAMLEASAAKIEAGDLDGGLAAFMEGIEGPKGWTRLSAVAKQQLRDNAYTLAGQAREARPLFTRADAESIAVRTLLIGGGASRGILPAVLRALAQYIPDSRAVMIPNTTHPMFEQAPQEFSKHVMEFLGE